jgi:hypothetical protein
VVLVVAVQTTFRHWYLEAGVVVELDSQLLLHRLPALVVRAASVVEAVEVVVQ